MLNRYYLYVTDAGGEWERFKDLMHPEFKLRKVSPYLTKKPSSYTEKDYIKLKNNLVSDARAGMSCRSLFKFQ